MTSVRHSKVADKDSDVNITDSAQNWVKDEQMNIRFCDQKWLYSVQVVESSCKGQRSHSLNFDDSLYISSYVVYMTVVCVCICSSEPPCNLAVYGVSMTLFPSRRSYYRYITL